MRQWTKDKKQYVFHKKEYILALRQFAIVNITIRRLVIDITIVLWKEVKSMKKKLVASIMATAMMTALLAGCGSSTSTASTETAATTASGEAATTTVADAGESNTESDVTLEWEVTATGDMVDVYQTLADDFTSQTGIKIELITPGSEYETVMKTRMASGDLPDVWATHGWSVARYSEYLRPLNDQDWYNRIDEAILPVISDDDGNIYCAPITEAFNTITYNKDVFEKAGVDASKVLTWDEFTDACAKIKDSGVTPIFIGDKDSSTIAQLAESIPPAYLTLECVEDNQKENLKNGSFSFEKYWTPINELIDGWMQSGYFNEDILTSDNDAACQALAKGECAMVFGGANNVVASQTYVPDANLGYLACPGVNEDDTTFLSMGEGTCFGMWKDTEHEDECLKFLEYMSTPEVCEKMSTASGDIPGFSDVSNEDSYVTQQFRELQKTYEGNIEYVPLFDREYLPSGMWDDLGVGLTKLVMDPGNAIEESTQYLQDAYDNKISE